MSSRLLIDEQPLQVIPSLACKVGLNRATFLQQLHYWLQKPGAHVKDGKRWIFNTYEEWHEQFPFWSVEAIRKIVSQLRDKGVIETTDKYNKRRADKTLWYTIDYEVFNALFGSEETPPDESTQTLNPPDKSTEPPDKSTDVEPDKSTERYQESTETTSRDSDLQSGEPPKAADTPTPETSEKVKPKAPGSFAVSELMDRVNAARKRGWDLHDPPSPGNYGQFFKNRLKRNEPETLLLALDYLVTRAAGEIDGEKKAWCGFDTALDAVNAGWRPKGAVTHLDDKRQERIDAENAENERLLQELMSDG